MPAKISPKGDVGVLPKIREMEKKSAVKEVTGKGEEASKSGFEKKVDSDRDALGQRARDGRKKTRTGGRSETERISQKRKPRT